MSYYYTPTYPGAPQPYYPPAYPAPYPPYPAAYPPAPAYYPAQQTTVTEYHTGGIFGGTDITIITTGPNAPPVYTPAPAVTRQTVIVEEDDSSADVAVAALGGFAAGMLVEAAFESW
mmetsp:Transcript_25397/g.55161  ORF Transcript_25397/g.55161 Transcript_25397/m.55161 type:complete len:117 (-) Transcript_25397:909-1259(-)